MWIELDILEIDLIKAALDFYIVPQNQEQVENLIDRLYYLAEEDD